MPVDARPAGSPGETPMPANDYITLLLINMSAALILLAMYLLFGLNNPAARGWAAGFAAVGLTAFVAGGYMALAWPLGEKLAWVNMTYGETTTLLGALYLGAALAVAKGWDLIGVSIPAALAGGVGIVLGIAIYQHDATNQPLLSASGFILTGAGAVLVLPAVLLRRVPLMRIVAAIPLLVAGLIWALTGYMAYWMHFKGAFPKL
jgi:putative membrane protein